MKKRFYSATALLLIVSLAVVLDQRFGAAWFSLALISATLLLGMMECFRLFDLWHRARSHGKASLIGRIVYAATPAIACTLLPGFFLLLLRCGENGLLRVLYLIAVTKMVDNGALFCGRAWGRRKLAPAISPAKTVEGAIGGLITGLVTALLLGPFCTGSGPVFSLLFGAIMGVFAILGDLAESYLKRRAGVKDSGTMMPGIGGVLDLVDSVLPAAPAAYLLFKLCITG